MPENFIYILFYEIGQSEHTTETSNEMPDCTSTPILVDFSQEVNEDLSRESSDSADWIRRLLTDDSQSGVERK